MNRRLVTVLQNYNAEQAKYRESCQTRIQSYLQLSELFDKSLLINLVTTLQAYTVHSIAFCFLPLVRIEIHSVKFLQDLLDYTQCFK